MAVKKIQITSLTFGALLCVGAHAEDEQLPLTEVRAEKIIDSSGVTSYDKAAISATPGGNGDIGSVLIRHGSVQFDDNRLSSDTPGDIAPSNISINGAKYYDNQFLLDGASITSGISGGIKGPGTVADTPDADQSQGMAVDVNMLCKLTVLDSNVSAEYGRFLGGVVDAEVCAPKKRFGGGFSVEHGSSKWLEKKNRDNSASADISKQDTFNKWTYRSNFESQVSDSVGLVGSFSRKTSSIPLRAYKSSFVSPDDNFIKSIEHKIDNYYLKGFFNPGGGVKSDVSLAWMPNESDMFTADEKNSGYKNKSGGLNLSAGLSHSWGSTLIRHKFSYKSLEASKDSDENDRKFWYKSADKNWSSNAYSQNEGGRGDIDQSEKTLGYKLDIDVFERAVGSALARLKVGAEYEYNNFSYDRKTQHYNYQVMKSSSVIPGVNLDYKTTSCNLLGGGVDTEYCSLAPATGSSTDGQFLNYRNKYRVGSFNHRSDYFALYLQNEMEWDWGGVKFGLRGESFSDAEKPTISPRFSANIKLSPGSVFGFGLNRYYGQNLKLYHIYDRKLALNSGYEYRQLMGGEITPWSTVADKAVPEGLASLKTPYADELALSYSKIIDNTQWKFKYVHRKGKDEVGRFGAGIKWGNVGESLAKTFSVELDLLEPLKILSSETSFALVFDYSTRKSNKADWNETNANGSTGVETQVWYQGQLIDKADLPADNYRRPWTLRLMSSTLISKGGVQFDSVIRIRQSYKKQMSRGKQAGYDVWGDVYMPKAINFDLRVSKKWNISRGNILFAELMLENVFNRSNAMGYDNLGYLYEKGRQATVRVGYEF